MQTPSFFESAFITIHPCLHDIDELLENPRSGPWKGRTATACYIFHALILKMISALAMDARNERGSAIGQPFADGGAGKRAINARSSAGSFCSMRRYYCHPECAEPGASRSTHGATTRDHRRRANP